MQPTPLDVPPGTVEHDHDLIHTTIADLGDRLPIGLNGDRTYEFHRPTMGVEKRIGSLRTRKDLQSRPGRFVCYYLARALKTLCGHTLADMKSEDEAALLVASLTMGDVFALLFARYRQKNRRGFPLTGFSCGACGANLDTVLVDLGSLEVDVAPAGLQAVELRARAGLYEGTADHRVVEVSPATWIDVMWPLSSDQLLNGTLVQVATIKSGIRRTNAREAPMSDYEVDDLLPEDAAVIMEALDRVTPTTDSEVQINCPQCGHEQISSIPWFTEDLS